MRGAVNSTDWTHRLDHYVRLLIVAWTILVGSLLAFNLVAQDTEIYDAARDVAHTAYLKDVAYRHWASQHGGVYVPIDASTPPNPYLANLPERDITTPSGKQLTLINPAYMVRQVFEQQAQSGGILSHLTSLNPIRPENAPDAWETEALTSFERGAPEASTIATINGVAYMRIMRPLITEASCVNCHNDYAVGSIRGGLSVAVPMQPLWDANLPHAVTLPIGHGLMWLLGLAMIMLGRSRLRQQLRARLAVETALRDSEARYRALVEQSPVSIVITDPTGNIEYVNPKFAAVSGYSFEEVLGKNPRILQSGEMTRDQYKVLWDTILAGGTWRGELHNKKKTGELYWEFASISSIKNSAGVITHFLAVKEDITDRKRAEEEIRNVAKFPAENPNPVLRVQHDGRVLYANDMGHELLQAWGGRVGDYVPAFWRELVAETAAARSDKVVDVQEAGRSWSFFVAPVAGEGYVNLYGNDVTERKQAEEALARLAAIVESSDDAIIGKTLTGEIISWNSGAERLYGYSAAEVIGRSISILLPPEQQDDLPRILDRIARGEHIHQFETTRQTKEGRIVDVALTISPIKNVAGQIVGASTIARDITDRKRIEEAEREQRMLAEALRDTAATLNTTLDFDEVLERILVNVERVVPHDEANIMLISGDTTYVCQSRGHALSAMPMAHLSLAQTPHLQQMIDTGQPVIIADVVHYPDWIHHVESDWVRSYLSAPIRIKGETVGFINLDSATPNFFNAGHATRLAIFANQAATAVENARLYQQAQTELSERRKVENQLQQAKDAAEAANQAKSVFLANMSHELRTPLNAILGFAQLLSHAPNLNVAQQDDLTVIMHSGQHLLDLINDVLDMSKIESGRMSVRNRNFDLIHLLDNLEEMFRLRAVEKGLALIFEIDPDLPRYIRADEGKLRQVLINLLGNAVKFTGSGRVTLRAIAELDRLHIEIEDTGPGLAAHELAVVFDPFVQIDSGQKVPEGTGLGLPISRQFVRLMGSDITASSEVGHGSVFKFDVKIEVVDAAAVPLPHSSRRVIALAPDQPAYRLLIVDDRDSSRQLLVKLLAPLGFDVREATNGQEAIELWEEWRPHLIWMDMRMPIMDGHTATQRIKATTRGQATVIIALTASAFQEERDVILSEGCDDFVRKPFSEDDIFDRLTKHLGVRFAYGDDAVQPAVDQRPIDALRPAVALSSDWLDQLRQATIQADLDRIESLIEHIRPQDATLADQLADWARNFNYDQLARFAEHSAIQAGRSTS